MILATLNEYYDRISDDPNSVIPTLGYSMEKISYAIVLDHNGNILAVDDVRDISGKKPIPKDLIVPQAVIRSSGIEPNFLWDKTSYVLGVSKSSKRTKKEHTAFINLHKEILKYSTDEGLLALLAFLENWEPDDFITNSLFVRYGDDLKDTNIVFRLNNEKNYLHERQAVQNLLLDLVTDNLEEKIGMCLVTGKQAPLARLHSAIKGVKGAQSSGAAIVSFNLNAFESYNKTQGENAPVSEEAAFKYTTALNYLLRKSDHNRQKIVLSDTTIVFWAQADNADEAEAAESMFASFLSPKDDDLRETERIRTALELLKQGRPLRDLDQKLNNTTRIFILGLAPNASRLSIRFWENNTLERFAIHLAQHYEDIRLEPSPWKTFPAIWQLLLATAPSRDGKSKSDDVPPHIAGEMMRAILTGGLYPQSLLGVLLMRMRADKNISGTRIALLKGVLTRFNRVRNINTNKGGTLMSLDTSNTDPGYLLGRLFASMENIQRSALGREINATIRDRYYGAASATPASIFPLLLRNTQNHLSKIRKEKPGWAYNFEKEIGGIIELLDTEFPKSLRLEAQGHFAIGYYHQNQARFASPKTINKEEGEEE